jgi:hypothetical protein
LRRPQAHHAFDVVRLVERLHDRAHTSRNQVTGTPSSLPPLTLVICCLRPSLGRNREPAVPILIEDDRDTIAAPGEVSREAAAEGRNMPNAWTVLYAIARGIVAREEEEEPRPDDHFVVPNAAPRANVRDRLSDPSHQKQDDDDDQHQSQPTTGSVAPTTAMRPSREGAD